jgi:glutathione S-transferase
MTMTLYGRPRAGSLAIEFLLGELGLPHDRVLVTGYRDGIEPPSYAALNPLRQVPALVLEDGTLLTESGAIMLHLADAHPAAGLAPAVGDPARAPYLRWMVYLAATIYPTSMCLFHPENYVDDAALHGAVTERAATVLAQQWRVVDAALGESGHLAGGCLSAADLYMAMFAFWFESRPDVGGLANTARLREAMKRRPAVQAALARQASREAWTA